MKAEQLIYTTGNVRGRKGYQVVAKSRGVSDGIESALRPHFHPPAIRPEDFTESHSLVKMADDNVAYCHARNIGAGYDGRRDTLCSHVMVFPRSDFAKLGYDTRLLSPLHPGNRRLRGDLSPIELDPSRMPPPPSPADIRELEPVLASALRLLLGGKRVAVPSADPTMAQKFLSILPPSARLVQFSSVATDADKQNHCDLLFYSPRKKPSPSAGFWMAAEPCDPSGGGGGSLDRAVRHYARLAVDCDRAHLERIQDRFEAVPALSGQDRMVLACACEQFLECGDDTSRKKCAADAFSAIKKLDAPAFAKHFDVIKNYVEPYSTALDTFRPDPRRSFDLFGAWLNSFPLLTGARLFSAFLDSYNRVDTLPRTSAGTDASTGAAPTTPTSTSVDYNIGGTPDVHTTDHSVTGRRKPPAS